MGTISKEDINRILSAAQERGFLRDYDGEFALSLQDLTLLSSDGRKELEELLEGARKQRISVGLEALIQELQRKLQALRENQDPTSTTPAHLAPRWRRLRTRGFGRQGLVLCFA